MSKCIDNKVTDAGIIPPVLTLPQVAEFLSCSRRFVEFEIQRGNLPAARLSNRCIRIRRSDLERYLERAVQAGSI